MGVCACCCWIMRQCRNRKRCLANCQGPFASWRGLHALYEYIRYAPRLTERWLRRVVREELPLCTGSVHFPVRTGCRLQQANLLR